MMSKGSSQARRNINFDMPTLRLNKNNKNL